MSSTYEYKVKLLWVVHMSQITMGSTYESNYYSTYEVVHMSQIDMSSTYEYMGSTYESNYYE